MRAIVHWRGGYVAYGDKGLWASTDGRAWQPATSDLPAERAVVTEVAGGLVALILSAVSCPVVGQSCFATAPGNVEVWTSADGLSWSDAGPATGLSGKQLVSVAGGSSGAVAAVTGDNKAGVFYSADGVTWKALSVPSVSSIFSCTYVAFGLARYEMLCPAAKETQRGDLSTQPEYSIDGIHWTAPPAPKTSDRPAGMERILVGRNGLIATGYIPGEAGPAEWWRSADGKSWLILAGYAPVGSYTVRNAVPGGTYPNGSLTADGTRIVALGFVADDGVLDGRVWSSWDGKSWQRLVSHGSPSGSGYYTVVFPSGIMAGGWWGAAA
jgi:hypothetical protein